MNSFLEKSKLFLSRNRAQVITVAIIIAVACVGAGISIYQSQKYAFEPVDACNLLTEDIAKELLGEKVIGITSGEPETENNIATSQCSYSDSNPNEDLMKVAAVSIMSPRNANGKETIKTGFESAKSSSAVQAVLDIGDSAFFDKSLGQLNVLQKNLWIRFSVGTGESIESTTIDDLLSFAKIILAEYNSDN